MHVHVLLSTYLYLHVYVAEEYSLCNSVISGVEIMCVFEDI